MKKYGVILRDGETVQVLKTCHTKEAVVIAVQLQKNIHPGQAAQITGVLGDFDPDDRLLNDRYRLLCA